MMQKAPKARKDGTCVVCRQLVIISPRKGVDPALYMDPFCSAVCAKKWFDVTGTPGQKRGRPRK